ncbi:Bug family tripartite tricarboxylate transporter substrate binding protein [Paraburkholderia sp. SIMBA_030]|uniref:Bug family tripartite tricarboxylate transporter substrate binding protein n=1 Tax=Paraburkholderia sp. SIMBA_030 TaxID=3085773 RepID=UPI00397B4F97
MPNPLHVLIGFSQHSASDDLLRCIEPDLGAMLGRPVKIDLMPGELGVKAAKAVISSPPDGSTILVATFGTHAINPNIRADLGYDPLNDFSPICLATRSPLVLGTRLSLQAEDVKGLVYLASKQELTFGSSGIGSAPYLAGLLFQRMTGAKLTHRPYADTGKLYDDLLTERLDLSFNNASSMLPLVRDKRLRALAVTTSARCAAAPYLPTMIEAGLDGYSLSNWLGFVAPPNAPASVITELNRALVVALRSPNNRSFFTSNGIDIVGSTPEAFRAYIAGELKRWAWLRDSVKM